MLRSPRILDFGNDDDSLRTKATTDCLISGDLTLASS